MGNGIIDRMLDTVDGEAAAAMVVEDILSDCGEGSLIAMQYAGEQGFVDPEDYDPHGEEGFDPDFLDFVRWMAADRIREEMGRIGSECVVDAGAIVLWRELVVDEHWIDGPFRERPIGVCWSWDRSYAKAHHGVDAGKPGRVRALVKGLCEPEDVDWTTTVALNAAAPYTVGDEKEIRLLPGRAIEIETILMHEGRIAEVSPRREVHWPGRLLTAEPVPDFSPAP